MTGEVAPLPENNERVRERKSFELLSVIVEKVTGTVKWFSINRRYGFIHRDDNNEDVFVHRTAIAASKQRFPSLKSGEPVEFSVVETKSGINAASVTGPGGKPVKGYRRFFNPMRTKSQSEAVESAPEQTNAESPFAFNEPHAGGDVHPPGARGGFRGRRRWSGRRPPRTSQGSVGDQAPQTEIKNEEGVSPTGDAPRLRPYPRRRRGRSVGNGSDNVGLRPLPQQDSTNGGASDQQQRPAGRFRRPFRRGGRQSLNGNRAPRPLDDDSAPHEHKEVVDAQKIQELPIEKEMEKMVITISPTEMKEEDTPVPDSAYVTPEETLATNEETEEGDVIGKPEN